MNNIHVLRTVFPFCFFGAISFYAPLAVAENTFLNAMYYNCGAGGICTIPAITGNNVTISGMGSISCQFTGKSGGYALRLGIRSGSTIETISGGNPATFMSLNKEGYIGVIADENTSGGIRDPGDGGTVSCQTTMSLGYYPVSGTSTVSAPPPYSRITTPSPVTWRIGTTPESASSAALIESPSSVISMTSYGTKSSVRLKSVSGSPAGFCSNVKTYLGNTDISSTATSFPLALTGESAVKYAIAENIAAANIGKFACAAELEVTTE